MNPGISQAAEQQSDLHQRDARAMQFNAQGREALMEEFEAPKKLRSVESEAHALAQVAAKTANEEAALHAARNVKLLLAQ